MSLRALKTMLMNTTPFMTLGQELRPAPPAQTNAKPVVKR